MPVMAAVALYGAYSASQNASNAQNAGMAANAQNIAFQQQMFQLQDPFSASGARAQYVPQLQNLMQGGYQGLQNDPMYQQLQNIGLQGTQRAMAAQGLGMGTNDLLAINQNQTGTAMNYFNQQYNRLAELSGASGGRTAPIQGMSAGTAADLAGGTAANRMGAIGMAGYGLGQVPWGSLSNIFGSWGSGSGMSGGATMTPAQQQAGAAWGMY